MNSKLVRAAILFTLLTALPSISLALTGKVVGVADGDTITILDSANRQHKIRLYGIDTPEKGQAFGQAAKSYTASLAFGKSAQVEVYDTDKYGRTVGVVTVNGVNINQDLIAGGFAWQYRKYCDASFCNTWIQLEAKAKLSGNGLWADSEPVPPWEWRRSVRNGSHNQTISSGNDTAAVAYHGNTKSHVFHSPSCRHYNCKNCNEIFSTRDSAISAGYRPCGICNL